MQYHVSAYGVFDQRTAQVFAFDEDTSFISSTALNAAYKAIFTLGINGQANTISGVAGGRRYASNLKWSYAAVPTTDVAIHMGTTLCDGCSRGDSAWTLDWTNLNTMFISDWTTPETWSYGRVNVYTGASSPGLTVNTRLKNEGAWMISCSWAGVRSVNDYTVCQGSINFRYIYCYQLNVDGRSYKTYNVDGTSDMRMHCASALEDSVRAVARYECIQDGRLFRFTPDDLDFGSLVAGTRPKVQKYLTASLSL